MAKPRKSTRDEMIDTFDTFDTDSQEIVLDQLELVHRLAKRRAGKEKPAEVPAGEQMKLKEPVSVDDVVQRQRERIEEQKQYAEGDSK